MNYIVKTFRFACEQLVLACFSTPALSHQVQSSTSLALAWGLPDEVSGGLSSGWFWFLHCLPGAMLALRPGSNTSQQCWQPWIERIRSPRLSSQVWSCNAYFKQASLHSGRRVKGTMICYTCVPFVVYQPSERAVSASPHVISMTFRLRLHAFGGVRPPLCPALAEDDPASSPPSRSCRWGCRVVSERLPD